MAKRRDQLIAMAQDREAGAKIATLKSIKEFSVTIGDIRRLRETKPDGSEGRVYKEVHLLNCYCRVAGVAEPITAEIEMSAGDDSGVAGELDLCVMPAVKAFLDRVKAAYIAAVKEKQKPLPEAPPPRYANPDGTMAKPVNPGRSEHMKKLNAEKQAKKAQETQGQAAPEAEKAEVSHGG